MNHLVLKEVPQKKKKKNLLKLNRYRYWEYLNRPGSNRCRILSPSSYVILRMPFDMFCEMIRSHEAPRANVAFEFFLSGVSPFMPRQFVRSWKLTIAPWPLTGKRLFTYKQINKKKKLKRLTFARLEVRFQSLIFFFFNEKKPLNYL